MNFLSLDQNYRATQKFLLVSSSTAPCNGCELHKLAAEDPASSQLKVARWKRGSVGGFTTRHQTVVSTQETR